VTGSPASSRAASPPALPPAEKPHATAPRHLGWRPTRSGPVGVRSQRQESQNVTLRLGSNDPHPPCRIGAADSRASGAGCGIQIALFCLPPTVPMRSKLALAATLGDTTSRAEHATSAVVACSYGPCRLSWRPCGGGGERGLVEDEPGVGDQAIIDDDALGTGCTFHRPGSVSHVMSAISSSPKAAIIFEPVRICTNGSMKLRWASAPSKCLCKDSLPRQSEILSPKASACRPNDGILTGRCHERLPLRAWLIFDAAQFGLVDEGLG
jgi:hypothetical protein